MSIENHPNLHVIKLMLEIHKSLEESLRGKGLGLVVSETLQIAKTLAEKAEELVDERLT